MTVAHPEELAELDLYEVWTSVGELTTRYDPFRFEQRMAAYRSLIGATSGPFRADNRLNPLWAWLFQLHWQCRTGRLGATTRADGRIDPDAAWGYGNYTLSAIPWLGAAEAGVVPPLEIADAPSGSRFRYVRAGVVPDELARAV